MKRLLIVFLTLAMFSALTAQNFAEDLNSVMNTFLKSESLQYQLRAVAIGVKNDEVIYNKEMKYKHLNDKVFIERSGIIEIREERNIFTLDLKNKKINLFRNSEASHINRKELAQLEFPVKDFQEGMEKIEFAGNQAGVLTYVLFPKDKEVFDQIRISIDSGQPFFKRVEYYYNTSNFPDSKNSIVHYENVRVNKEISGHPVSLDEYVYLENGEYKLKKSYENFELNVYESE